MAAGLATLAIETSRLYCDLVHRSEFDLLTDVPNRFSMEKTLDTLIQDARQSAGIFGLIYIDLNEFKQVNDAYGHQAGDLYLQEMVRRMKRQLRPGDTLARLGGDEFAVLVSGAQSRRGGGDHSAAGMLLRRAIHGRGICGAWLGQHRLRDLSRRCQLRRWPASLCGRSHVREKERPPAHPPGTDSQHRHSLNRHIEISARVDSEAKDHPCSVALCAKLTPEYFLRSVHCCIRRSLPENM